jgi:hypothetical protein
MLLPGILQQSIWVPLITTGYRRLLPHKKSERVLVRVHIVLAKETILG